MNGHDVRAPVSPGDILAEKYRVDRVLGVGGMGIVVAATHEALDQKVAIKFLLPNMIGNADLVRRFLREGRAAGKLKSEHVAKVIDVGRLENGSPYMVLEYLEGRDLSEVLKDEGPLPVTLAVRFILQAIEAVAEAHANKLIHRDIKPQNLFLTHRVNGDPLVKVLDFGISKALEEASAEFALTRSQSLLGSPLYMSPEQMRSSRAVDERSDIWSLGVLLHELLTARHPFESETIPGLVFQVTMEDPTPLRVHRADVDPGIELVIARCLQKKADDRYANVAELAKDLEPHGGDAVRGLAASIASVLKPTGARSAFASFSDISGGGDNPLAPTLDAKSDPDLARQLEQSASRSREVAAKRDSGPEVAKEPVGAASAWGATQNGATPPRRPIWMFGVAALGLVGLGVMGALLATSKTGNASTPAVSGSVSGAAVAPSATQAIVPAAPPPTTQPTTVASPSPSPVSSIATAMASGTHSVPKGSPKPSPSAPIPVNSAPVTASAPPVPVPSPSTKPPTPKPTASGPPGFVPYGE